MAIEVDENELAAKNRVVGWVNQALQNPKTRQRVLEIQHELDPNFSAPELQVRQYVDEQLGGIKQLIENDIAERNRRDQEREEAAQKTALEQQWASGRRTAKAAGYTDDGLGKLEDYMQQHGIMDHGIAMPAFERENPLPKPIESGDNRWGFFDAQTTESPDLKPLFDGNDEQFLNTQITATLREIRGGR